MEIYLEENNFNKEWIFDDENYLEYLLMNVYKMKNPKFSHTLKSKEDDSSVNSYEEINIKKFISNDWSIIYESPIIIDYNNIYEKKKILCEEKINDNYFIELTGLNEDEKLSSYFNFYNEYSSNSADLFSNYTETEKKVIIFHNEDKYFKLNLLKELEYYYFRENFCYLYINFDYLKKIEHQKRLELFAYSLLSLFPKNFQALKEYYEKIKNILSDKLECLPQVIDEIIKNFSDNIIGKKMNVINNLNKNKEEKDNLFKGKEDKKLYFVIFDDIINIDYNNIVEQIINKHSSNNNFKFIKIYPLINGYTLDEFFDYIFLNYDPYFPFTLYFANFYNFSKNGLYLEDKDINIKNIKEFQNNDEKLIYDLIRIYNFKDIFINSEKCEKNYESIISLKKYFKYFHILFDNDNKKIINIVFKMKKIEEEFNNKYQDTLTYIKTKNNYLSKGILDQRDFFDIKKIIISTILYNRKVDFETLELKSIFGFKEIIKKERVNYQFHNFFLKQKSLGAEIFDFGMKIIYKSKQFLKSYQAIFDKNDEELEKMSIERIRVYCSYLKKKFIENNLGEFNEIIFGIIAPISILENKNKYRTLKTFCKQNRYEFILFDINNRSFYVRKNKINIPYDQSIYEINEEYCIQLLDFNSIINLDNNIKMLSTRKVRERNEKKEDEDAQMVANKKINKKFKRVSKLEFFGSINDIKEVNENYFCYIYNRKKNYCYFYKNEIIESTFDKNEKSKLIIILYSTEYSKFVYEESNLSNEKLKKTQKKNKDKNNKNKVGMELDEDNQEEGQKNQCQKNKKNKEEKKREKKDEKNKAEKKGQKREEKEKKKEEKKRNDEKKEKYLNYKFKSKEEFIGKKTSSEHKKNK